MPKQSMKFRTKLAGTVVTLSMVAAPVAAFAANDLDGNINDPVAQEQQAAEDDALTNVPTEGIPTPEVPAGELEKPVSEGLGPLGGVMPTLDGNGYNTNKVPNKTGQVNKGATYKAQKASSTTSTTTTKATTTTTSNPKTGDVSILGYAGISLASMVGLLNKRKF